MGPLGNLSQVEKPVVASGMHFVLLYTVLFHYVSSSAPGECALLREEFEALKSKTEMWSLT